MNAEHANCLSVCLTSALRALNEIGAAKVADGILWLAAWWVIGQQAKLA